jgi:peptide/nickel transport system permease protein
LIKRLVKQTTFWIGSLFFLVLLLASFTLTSIYEIPEYVKYLYDDGKLIGVAPFSPSEVPPFGTDRFGKNLLYEIILGAKYTILIACGVAILRVLLAGIFAVFYNQYSKWLQPLSEDFIEASTFVPPSIIAFMLMTPLFTQHSTNARGFGEILTIQMIILVLIGIPPLLSTFAKDMSNIMNKEYVISTLSLGANTWYVYYKHVLPEISNRFILLFAQQVIQVLILFTHLAVFLIFLGGSQTFVKGVLVQYEVNVSLTGEWSGLIGQSYNEVMLAPWIVLFPLAFFAITILALNLIINGIQKAMNTN